MLAGHHHRSEQLGVLTLHPVGLAFDQQDVDIPVGAGKGPNQDAAIGDLDAQNAPQPGLKSHSSNGSVRCWHQAVIVHLVVGKVRKDLVQLLGLLGLVLKPALTAGIRHWNFSRTQNNSEKFVVDSLKFWESIGSGW